MPVNTYQPQANTGSFRGMLSLIRLRLMRKLPELVRVHLLVNTIADSGILSISRKNWENYPKPSGFSARTLFFFAMESSEIKSDWFTSIASIVELRWNTVNARITEYAAVITAGYTHRMAKFWKCRLKNPKLQKDYEKALVLVLILSLNIAGWFLPIWGRPSGNRNFPIYDACIYDDMTSATYKAPYRCNWIQVLDAIMDPTHTTYLHSRNSHPQFSEGMKAEGVLKFYERNDNHFLGSSTRRVGDNVWIRVNELVLPNFTQAGSAFAVDGTRQCYFGRSCFTRWVVPVDDENSIVYAWANFGSRWDPHEYNNKEGHEMIEQGEILDRTLEERKRFPADSEAVEGMGFISTHKGENLMPTDRGISLYRRRVRQQVRALANQIEPPQPVKSADSCIRTYGQDTVLTLPSKNGEDDRQYLDRIGTVVMEMQFDLEGFKEGNRDDEIVTRLKKLETDGVG